MRVLLVNPAFPVFPNYPRHASPPLGLAYLAGSLERAGHDVRIVDCIVEDFKRETQLDETLRVHGWTAADVIGAVDQPPELVAIACVFSTLDRVVRRFAARFKEAWPGVPVVTGGAHATAMAEDVARDGSIDYVIRGEGDEAICRLADYLERRIDIREVNNLTWADGETVYETGQTFVDDPDTLPLPARHLLDMDAYARIGHMQGISGSGRKATTLITSRGCTAKCRFCSIHGVWGRRFRPHSAGRVLEEIVHLYNDYGIRHLLFEDDNLTFDRERAKAIFRGILDRGLDLTWTAPNGVALWSLDEELLGLIRATGCTRLSLGVESGDPDTLRRIIRKPLKLDRVDRLVATCRDLGIATTAFFVVGLPGETTEAMKRSLEYAERLAVDSVCISIASPFPGTEIYDECREKGYLVEGFSFDNLMTQVGNIRTEHFTPAEVEALVARTHLRRAFRHPRRTLKRLAEKFRGSPKETFTFVVNRTVSKLWRKAG